MLGGNFYGQLGLGNTIARGDQMGEMATNLPSLDFDTGVTATRISAGDMHTCAQLSPVVLKCWGNNSFGQLGLGDTNHCGDEPNEMGANLEAVDVGVPPGIIIKDIRAGGTHSCVLLSDGTVKCWGKNDFGQLGLGDKNARGDELGEMGESLPIVNLGAGVIATEVHAGHSHTCALLSSGRVKCWGRSVYGQLGQSDTITRGDEPGDMGDKLNTVDL